MNITRRDLLTIAGGSIVGALFTPIPWKLLDDSAIWTQNWSLIPKLPRGPITFAHTACALCPGGCTVRARCVNTVPVSLTGVAGSPISYGALCPAGIAGHHLATHPLRLRQSFRFDGKTADSPLTPLSVDDIVAGLAPKIQELRASGTHGAVAILDHHPGRAISQLYKEFLGGFQNGRYILAPESEDSTLTTLRALGNANDTSFGYDFEHARVVLSFGAPLLDGWGTPGRMAAVFGTRKQTGLKLIQIECTQSRTALQADTWLPATPGSEAALALALGHVILRDGLVPAATAKTVKDLSTYKELVAEFSPEAVSNQCGIPAQLIVRTAHDIASPGSIVLSGSNPGGGPFNRATETAIAGLNILLGNVGTQGGIQSYPALPAVAQSPVATMDLAQVPDHSIQLLFVDGAERAHNYPASLIKRKLAGTGATVVQLSPYLSSRSALADYLIALPAAYESIEEITTPQGASKAMFALSMPLHVRPASTVDPVAFIARLSEAAGLPSVALPTSDLRLKQRAQAIWQSKRGTLTSPANTATAVKDIASEDDFWKSLAEGGLWIDVEPRRSQVPPASLMGNIATADFRTAATPPALAAGSLKLIPFGWGCTTSTAQVAPVMSKLFQESHLRSLGGQVHINPNTLVAHGLTDAAQVRVTTAIGSITAEVVADPAVMPGLIHASVGPARNNAAPKDRPEAEGILEICAVEADGSWRITQATIARA